MYSSMARSTSAVVTFCAGSMSTVCGCTHSDATVTDLATREHPAVVIGWDVQQSLVDERRRRLRMLPIILSADTRQQYSIERLTASFAVLSLDAAEYAKELFADSRVRSSISSYRMKIRQWGHA